MKVKRELFSPRLSIRCDKISSTADFSRSIDIIFDSFSNSSVNDQRKLSNKASRRGARSCSLTIPWKNLRDWLKKIFQSRSQNPSPATASSNKDFRRLDDDLTFPRNHKAATYFQVLRSDESSPLFSKIGESRTYGSQNDFIVQQPSHRRPSVQISPGDNRIISVKFLKGKTVVDEAHGWWEDNTSQAISEEITEQGHDFPITISLKASQPIGYDFGGFHPKSNASSSSLGLKIAESDLNPLPAPRISGFGLDTSQPVIESLNIRSDLNMTSPFSYEFPNSQKVFISIGFENVSLCNYILPRSILSIGESSNFSASIALMLIKRYGERDWENVFASQCPGKLDAGTVRNRKGRKIRAKQPFSLNEVLSQKSRVISNVRESRGISFGLEFQQAE
jgi:hypothetical protein